MFFIVVVIVCVVVELVVHKIRSQISDDFRPRFLLASSLSAVDLARNGLMCCRQPGNVDKAYTSGLLETERLQ